MCNNMDRPQKHVLSEKSQSQKVIHSRGFHSCNTLKKEKLGTGVEEYR